MVENPKSKSTQPRFASRWNSLNICDEWSSKLRNCRWCRCSPRFRRNRSGSCWSGNFRHRNGNFRHLVVPSTFKSLLMKVLRIFAFKYGCISERFDEYRVYRILWLLTLALWHFCLLYALSWSKSQTKFTIKLYTKSSLNQVSGMAIVSPVYPIIVLWLLTPCDWSRGSHNIRYRL